MMALSSNPQTVKAPSTSAGWFGILRGLLDSKTDDCSQLAQKTETIIKVVSAVAFKCGTLVALSRTNIWRIYADFQCHEFLPTFLATKVNACNHLQMSIAFLCCNFPNFTPKNPISKNSNATFIVNL